MNEEMNDVIETVDEDEDDGTIKRIKPTETADIVDEVNAPIQQAGDEDAPQQEQMQTLNGEPVRDTSKMVCVDINSRVDINSLLSKLFAFEKVPYEVFRNDALNTAFRCQPDDEIERWIHDWYEEIKLPQASTTLSAGFDFFAPYSFRLTPKTEMIIPTGIRWTVNQESMEVARKFMEECGRYKVHSIDGSEYKDLALGDKMTALHASADQIVSGVLDNFGLVLEIFPRSGHAFKYNIRIANTVGIIDEDYYKSESNMGHIMIKLAMDAPRHSLVQFKEFTRTGVQVRVDEESRIVEQAWVVNQGEAFAQGIVTPYAHNFNFTTDVVRDGGFGSTDNK